MQILTWCGLRHVVRICLYNSAILSPQQTALLVCEPLRRPVLTAGSAHGGAGAIERFVTLTFLTTGPPTWGYIGCRFNPTLICICYPVERYEIVIDSVLCTSRQLAYEIIDVSPCTKLAKGRRPVAERHSYLPSSGTRFVPVFMIVAAVSR